MSQNAEFLYFNVGLLKGSFGLDALREDAMKYHMIDSPGQLIALRLTEYYELMARGAVPSGTFGPAAGGNLTDATVRPAPNGERLVSSPPPESDQPSNTLASDDNYALTASSEADRNADEAADYWSLL